MVQLVHSKAIDMTPVNLMNSLANWLANNNIPYKLFRSPDVEYNDYFDRWGYSRNQIRILDFDEPKFSIICHPYSQGYTENLIEAWDYDFEDPIGNLTLAEVKCLILDGLHRHNLYLSLDN